MELLIVLIQQFPELGIAGVLLVGVLRLVKYLHEAKDDRTYVALLKDFRVQVQQAAIAAVDATQQTYLDLDAKARVVTSEGGEKVTTNEKVEAFSKALQSGLDQLGKEYVALMDGYKGAGSVVKSLTEEIEAYIHRKKKAVVVIPTPTPAATVDAAPVLRESTVPQPVLVPLPAETRQP